MENELKELEQFLNITSDLVQEGFSFKVEKDADEIELKVIYEDDADESKIINCYSTTYYDDLETNIVNLINNIYETDINHRKHFITKFKGSYITQKMKSLSNAIGKNDTEKVSKINNDMITKFEEVQLYKFEIGYFKRFVSLLYQAKDELCGQQNEERKEVI